MKIQNVELDSDSHNFGRRTFISAQGRITKYRSLLAEYVFFGSGSSFRQHVNKLFNQVSQGVLLPALEFYQPSDTSVSLAPREMEQLILTPLERPFQASDYHQIGAYIALCAFVGLNDSHRHNIMLGLHNGVFTFVSVDCETMLSDIPHAITLGLFRHESNCPCKSKFCFHYGLSALKLASEEHLDSMPADIIWGHRAMRRLLLEHKDSLNESFAKTLNHQPLVLRKLYNFTYVYFQSLKAEDFSTYSNEEALQMKRGDIPYFFQIYGDENVYYWQDERNYTRHSKSSDESLFKTRLTFEHSDILDSQIMLQIAASVDFWPGRISQSISDDIRVLYKKDSVVVMCEDLVLTHPRMPL